MATPRFVSASNGFVPRATGQAISYIRNKSTFPLKDYVQFIESPATQGLYAVIDRDTPARVVTDSEYAWEDSSERPITNYGGLVFNWVPFTVFRRNYGTMLGHQAIDMCKDSWKLLDHTVGSQIQIAYTNRTNRVMNLLQTPGNWGNNTADANTLNGGAGTWDKASDDPTSANYNAIKKSLLEAMRQIALATNSIVTMDDLVLLLSPGLAQAMGNSAEIHAYLKHGQYSFPVIEGEKRFREKWGLPSVLYGFDIKIEDTVRVTDRPIAGHGTGTLASNNRVFVKNDNTAVIASRKGGIDGEFGSPSFSTVQMYWYEYEAAVFTFDDVENARTKVHVTDQFQEILAAPETGYLITSTM